ncbi:MAG: hypothetical protein B7X10_00240 [Burkholderiales bacterium 21-58-4]|nr:MAG: hypothetical protein B7X10_00240 [Burkholderiales bacterium 21-58-4]
MKKWLRAGVSEDGQWSPSMFGTPQGPSLPRYYFRNRSAWMSEKARTPRSRMAHRVRGRPASSSLSELRERGWCRRIATATTPRPRARSQHGRRFRGDHLMNNPGQASGIRLLVLTPET